MKAKKYILLSILSISLMGCSGNSNTNSNAQSKSIETSVNSTNSKSNKEDTNKSETITDKASTSKKSETDEESSWPSDIASSMYKHLDKRIIPYIDLKLSYKNGYMLDWNREDSNLSIVSSYRTITSSMIDEAKKNYQNDGWDVKTDDESLIATNEEKDLTVTFFLNEGLLTLNVKFDEKFDSSARDQYDEDLLSNLNNLMDNHGTDIPYIYLGSTNLDGETSDDGTYIIKGGIWNDEILSIAKNAINKVNKSIIDDSDKWTVNTDSEKEYEVKRNLADGCGLKLNITSIKGDRNKNKNYAQLKITYKAKYNPSSETSWNDTIKNFFSNNCDNHSIPYFYLGSNEIEESESSTYSATYLAKDNTWSDLIVTQAKNACTDEDTSIQDENYKWQFKEETKSEDNTKTLKATKNYSDGCSLTFKVSNVGYNDGDKAKLEIYYEPKYEEGENTSWSNTTKSLMTSYLNTTDIPFVNLGTQDEKAFYNETTKTLEITGGTYYSSVLKGAKTNFTSSNWTNEIKTVEASQNNEAYTYQYFVAEKTIDENTKLKVTVDSTMHSIYFESGSSGKCIMKIELVTTFTPPSDEDANWNKYTYLNQKVSYYINKYLDNHSIPFVYLNTTNLEINFSAGENTLYITGGKWIDELLTYAKSNFENDSTWTDIELDSDNNTLSAKCVEDDGCTLNATFYKTTSGYAELKVKIDFGFINVTSWSTEVENGFKSTLNNHVLPLVQLGSKNPNISISNNFITLSTSAYKDTLLDDAKTILAADGWTTFIDPIKKNVVNNNTYNYLISFKEYSDGIVYLYIYCDANGTTLTASYHSSPSNQTKTDWSDTEKAAINDMTSNQLDLIPFLYMGNNDYTINTSTSKIEGNTLACYSIISYYQKLNTLGYKDISLYIDSSNVNLEATYIDENNNQIFINIKKKQDLRGTYTSLEINYNSNN